MLRIYIEVSVTGLSDGSFGPLTDYDDPGGQVTYDHQPVTPGQLYIYRVRRFDTATGLYSAWSYAYTRAIYPLRNPKTMMDTTEVVTGSDERLGIAIEVAQGIPTKVLWLGELVSGEINRSIQRAFSRAKRKALTLRNKVVKTAFGYNGSYVFEVSAEGAFPRLLSATYQYQGATTLSSPTRYVHRWSNKEGAATLTVVHQKGDVYKVYPGAKVNNFEINPALGSDTVASCTFGFVALDEITLPLWLVPTAATITGMSTAAGDVLAPYAGEDAVAILSGVDGEDIRSYSYTYAKDLGAYKGFSGTHGAKGHVERSGDPTLQVSAVFNRSSMIAVYRDEGYATEPVGAFSATPTVVTVPFHFVFNPPNNAAGFSNTFGIYNPNTDVMITGESASDREEIILSMQVMPLDLVGEASGTDSYIEMTNSITETQMRSAGTPWAPTDVPVGKSVIYAYGVVQASPTTTTISAGAANPHLSTTDNLYVGRRVRMLTGTLASTDRTVSDRVITAYTGSTKTFTFPAYGSAPSAGDIFQIL